MKKIIFLIPAFILAACASQVTVTLEVTVTLTPTSTPVQTQTPMPSATPTITPIPTFSPETWDGMDQTAKDIVLASCVRDDPPAGCGGGTEPGTTAGGCQTPCGKDMNGNQKICCRATSCGNTCTNTPPGTPVQVSPVNNATVVAPVTLTWNPFSLWGEACTGGNNQIFVYVGTTNPPITSYATDNPTTYNFTTATPGTTYYWYVKASNGPTSTNSAIWSFTVGACNNLAPTNVVVTGDPVVTTTATGTWTPGDKGTYQLLRVGENLTEVNNGCGGTYSPACIESVTFPTYTAPTTPASPAQVMEALHTGGAESDLSDFYVLRRGFIPRRVHWTKAQFVPAFTTT